MSRIFFQGQIETGYSYCSAGPPGSVFCISADLIPYEPVSSRKNPWSLSYCTRHINLRYYSTKREKYNYGTRTVLLQRRQVPIGLNRTELKLTTSQDETNTIHTCFLDLLYGIFTYIDPLIGPNMPKYITASIIEHRMSTL